MPGAKGPLTKIKKIVSKLRLTEGIYPGTIAVSFHCGHWAYGRYASGNALDKALTGTNSQAESAWWQKGVSRTNLDDPTQWSELRGVHPNWIIPNTPARVSGQFRSNDTVVRIRLV